MNTSAKFNALFRDVSVGALSALTTCRPAAEEENKFAMINYPFTSFCPASSTLD